MHHLMGLVPPDQIALSLGRPLCVRRGSSGLQNQTGPLPHHAWAGRRETTGPRLAPGGWWGGHVQMSNGSFTTNAQHFVVRNADGASDTMAEIFARTSDHTMTDAELLQHYIERERIMHPGQRTRAIIA